MLRICINRLLRNVFCFEMLLEVVTPDISAWKKGAVPIGEEVRVFVFEATRGGLRSALQDAGDVAIDDVLLKEGACAGVCLYTGIADMLNYCLLL